MRISFSKNISLLMALGLLFLTPKLHASDTFNFCASHDPGQEILQNVSLPGDDSLHFSGGQFTYPKEEWYWNGNVTTPQGKVYGFELIVFQFTFDFGFQFPVRFAQVSLSDVEHQVYHNESYVDLTTGTPFQVTDSGFNILVADPNSAFRMEAVGGSGNDHVKVTFRDGSAYDLLLASLKNPSYNFHNGFGEYDNNGTVPSHGHDHYYSRTRMATAGSLTVNGKKKPVVGEGWFDREFGALINDTQWVWYSIRLNNGEEIHMYDMRAYPGKIRRDQFMTGEPLIQVVNFLGQADSCDREEINGDGFEATFSGEDFGPSGLFAWPTSYGLSVPSKNIELTLTPAFQDQEVSGTGLFAPTWEGLAYVSGTENGQPISGNAYIETISKCCNPPDGDDFTP